MSELDVFFLVCFGIIIFMRPAIVAFAFFMEIREDKRND